MIIAGVVLGMAVYFGPIAYVTNVAARASARERAQTQVQKHYSHAPRVRLGRDCLPAPLMQRSDNYMRVLSVPSRKLDGDGIIMRDYGSAYEGAGWQKTPKVSADFAMAALNAWCEKGDPVGLNIALSHAEWFVESAVRTDDFIVWTYKFPNSFFGAASGWASGLGNGFAIAFLAQIYHLTGKETYHEVARAGVRAFSVNMDEGGLLSYMDDGESIFFEEVAQEGLVAAHILNGHMFALEGLAYAADHLNDERARRLFEEGSQSVARYAQAFAGEEASYYALGPEEPYSRGADNYAHRLHVMYMAYLYDRFGDPVYLKYERLWAAQMNDPSTVPNLH